jgi:L,D-transpeptidase catalytic domain
MRLCGCAFMLVLAAAASPSARASVLVTIDKSTQQMSVSVDGVPRWHWRVSTGVPGRDTPSGTFRAFRMEATHFSKEFDDAPMPHSIFFTKIGHAIHGYLDTRRLGEPASHGCVRLDPANAAKLYALVQQEGVLNTTVVVTGSVSAAVARRRAPSVRPAEADTAPLALAPPAAARSYDSSYSAPRAYVGSGDARFAPMTVYRQPDAARSGYGEPPTPPPAYPPFPRPGFLIDDGR